MIEKWKAEQTGRITFHKVYKDILGRLDPRSIAKYQHLIDKFNDDAGNIYLMLIFYVSLRIHNSVEYQKALTHNKFITEAYSGFVDDNRVQFSTIFDFSHFSFDFLRFILQHFYNILLFRFIENVTGHNVLTSSINNFLFYSGLSPCLQETPATYSTPTSNGITHFRSSLVWFIDTLNIATLLI